MNIYKKSLAAHNRLSKTLLPLIPLTILTIYLYQLNVEEFTGTVITIMIILYTIFFILIYKGYTGYDIYYNESCMLLEGRTETIVVPFSAIRLVRITTNRLNYMGFILFQYNIEYLSPNNRNDEIHLWSYLGSDKMDKFVHLVKAKNQQLKVEQGSTP